MRYLSFVGKVVGAALATESYKATKYVEPKLVIKATRREKVDKREKSLSFVVSIGRPNYLEAKFIKACVAAGEPFPVRKIQLKAYPVKRK